ncbi:MAG TPA: hypothetical protein VFG08_00225 [Candidatus Polarisedimenticolia bacterium]|nr:hypothetical protein [Candidatus Polarisedimenticolia bacterium]
MSRISAARRRSCIIPVVALSVLCIVPTPVIPSSPHQQARALADLVSGIITCSVPPCIGTEAEAFDSLVRGQYAADGDLFTDFGMAYQRFAHQLQGVVMWDVGRAVDAIYFVFTEFHAPPAVLIAELESAGLKCEEEEDPEEGQQEWFCAWPAGPDDEYELSLYIGNGVLLMEF